MNRVLNPYNPGAGTPPPALVGRGKQLEDMDVALQRGLLGRPAKSVMLTGLRGVGKTVLLHAFTKSAVARGYVTEHIEADETLDFPSAMANAIRKVLLRISASKRMGAKATRALGILKAFSLRLPEGSEFKIDVSAVSGPADSGDLAADLSGLLCEVGDVAQSSGIGILITIDELQYLAPRELSALMVGLHRVSQLSLPLIIAGAGLPSLPGMMGEAKSYAERMFDFPLIGSLSRTDAAEAIVRPALDETAQWSEGALDLVLDLTQGYPYFLQEFGKQIWDIAEGPVISRKDVESSIPLTQAEMDSGFFRVRVDRATAAERAYMRTMADFGPGPYPSTKVARKMERTPQQLGPLRDSLIKRGLCYSPRRGEIAFTVPMFDGFMRRWMP